MEKCEEVGEGLQLLDPPFARTCSFLSSKSWDT